MRTIFQISLLSILLFSCSEYPSGFQTEKVELMDSTKVCKVSFSVEFPTGLSSSESLIRDSLFAELERNAGYFDSELPGFESLPYEGDDSNVRERAGHYWDQLVWSINQVASSEETYYPWEYSINISLVRETATYVVFGCTNYLYMGGAHGGVTGAGPMTFGKDSGHKIRKFVKDSALMPLQDVLKQGLIEYFSEGGDEVNEDNLQDQLFEADGIIPLPILQPEPTDKGLKFIYQQYEIAPYAAGMPSFTVPYDILRPYLTDEALEIL